MKYIYVIAATFDFTKENGFEVVYKIKEIFPLARLTSSGKTFRSNKWEKNIAMHNFPHSSESVLPARLIAAARSHRKSFTLTIYHFLCHLRQVGLCLQSDTRNYVLQNNIKRKWNNNSVLLYIWIWIQIDVPKKKNK